MCPSQPSSASGPTRYSRSSARAAWARYTRRNDPRLNRTVAIKILLESFAGDDKRLRRFEQEAHALAALNHPNIVAVYDVGSHEGKPYLVTEFLAGETLRERLNRGAIPVRKAISFAEGIAEALSAAHSKDIIHRDLKPELVRENFSLLKPDADSPQIKGANLSRQGLSVCTLAFGGLQPLIYGFVHCANPAACYHMWIQPRKRT